jgi:hypothetical protein
MSRDPFTELRFEWWDAIFRDRTVSREAFSLAYLLGTAYFNRVKFRANGTLAAFPKQATLAASSTAT